MTLGLMSAEATASLLERHLVHASKSFPGADECENQVKVSDIHRGM